jgi:hypothetical protein
VVTKGHSSSSSFGRGERRILLQRPCEDLDSLYGVPTRLIKFNRTTKVIIIIDTRRIIRAELIPGVVAVVGAGLAQAV